MSERLAGVDLPERAERLDALRTVIGEPRASSAIVPERIWAILEARYDRVVTPIIDRTWPQGEDGDIREHFLRKSRFIARRYASLSYVPVALGTASPLRVLPFAAPLERLTLGTALRVAEPVFVRGAAAAVPAFLAAVPIDARLTDLLAGICTAYDQCFDDWPDDVDPVERHRHIERMFRRPEEPPRGPEPSSTALTRALLVEVKGPLGRRYDELIDIGRDASEAEMRLELGQPDPESLSHRRTAAEGTVDTMIIQSDSVAPVIRDWMHDLAVFTQLVDDWVDVETDLTLRETPVLTGSAGLADLEAGWARLLGDITGMLEACGIHGRRIAELVEDAVRYVLWSGIDGMERRIAD